MWSGMTWRWQWQNQRPKQERQVHVPQWELFNPSSDKENNNQEKGLKKTKENEGKSLNTGGKWRRCRV